MYKVMIVDDMEIFRRDFKRLRVWGNNPDFILCEEASDGPEALLKLEDNPVDVMFIDIKMPKMDGIELLRLVKERKLCPFVILLSDFTEYSYARQGFVYGAFDYIGKDIGETEFDDLLQRIRQQYELTLSDEKKQSSNPGTVEAQFYSNYDYSLIVQLIGKGDNRVLILTGDMIDTIMGSVSDDNRKAFLMIRNVGQEIMRLLTQQHPWLPYFVNSQLLQTMSPIHCEDGNAMREKCMAAAEHLLSVMQRSISSYDHPLVRRICEYILVNVHEKLSVKMIAERMYISKSHLSEIFKQNTGITLLEYITAAKMERAKILLIDDNLKLYEIAFQLGFQDNEYFNKVFKRYTGVSLTEYRKAATNNGERG